MSLGLKFGNRKTRRSVIVKSEGKRIKDDDARPLHNPHFCPILVIARSKATRQSRDLSMRYEIASLRSILELCKGLDAVKTLASPICHFDWREKSRLYKVLPKPDFSLRSK